MGALGDSASERAARDFARAWERGDYRAMYRLLGSEAKDRVGPAEFARTYERAKGTATQRVLAAGDPDEAGDGRVRVPMTVRTYAFGVIREHALIPVANGKIDWRPHLVFPGVAEGQSLTRQTRTPRRATILSRGGKTLATGRAEARTYPLGVVSESIAGSVGGAPTAAEREEVYARGFSRDQPIGRSGLERVFEPELAGRPGGLLLAGAKVLAQTRPRASAPLRSTIDTRIQRAAATALAGRFGGVAALDARTAEVRALAGIAFSAPQPPGSTFKIVTATAALEAGLVKPSTRFPVETRAVIDGVELENANGESCGGSFQSSFAHSCNSVFAPLGVRLGAQRLVRAAERYGFNDRPTIPGAAASTIPAADTILSPLDVGSTAIGQGRVLATPLALASVAQAVAMGGVRREPTLRPTRTERQRPVRVTQRRIARRLERMMLDVVRYGTGTRAALDGVGVAGKTGTAELEDTRGPAADDDEEQKPGADTDAWFTAYAPARRPKVTVAVLFVRHGAGGDTAAPAAKQVLAAALR